MDRMLIASFQWILINVLLKQIEEYSTKNNFEKSNNFNGI